MPEKFNTNQKIVISLIASPILVYLIIGFLGTEFDLIKWNSSLRFLLLMMTPFTYVCIFAFLDAFKETKKK